MNFATQFEGHKKVQTSTANYDKITGEVLPSRTKQSDKAGCDIHTILRKIEQGAMLPDMIKRDAQYGDFASVKDFQSSMELVFKAQEQFAALPAKARDRFDNNPEAFLKFMAKPDAKVLIELGLATLVKPQESSNAAPKPPAKEKAAEGSFKKE